MKAYLSLVILILLFGCGDDNGNSAENNILGTYVLTNNSISEVEEQLFIIDTTALREIDLSSSDHFAAAFGPKALIENYVNTSLIPSSITIEPNNLISISLKGETLDSSSYTLDNQNVFTIENYDQSSFSLCGELIKMRCSVLVLPPNNVIDLNTVDQDATSLSEAERQIQYYEVGDTIYASIVNLEFIK